MTEILLPTKLSIPPTRFNLVARPRLLARMNDGLCREECFTRKLTLVSAPAGYGKTTLVTEWLQGLQIETAWLSLDESDNDPRRFLTYLFAALRTIEGKIGQAAEVLLQSPQPPPGEIILTSLVGEIAAVPRPFMLILDDYHVIHTPPISQQLAFLLDHQPPQMHLALITREDPPLPLARLRARGQMVEIRQEDLRFSLEECTHFLNQVMGLTLSAPDIAALERRTEGWIAGLQLAALSMRGRTDLSSFVEAFTGSSHFVLDYLIEEVFKQQTVEIQDFLLKTAILDRLCGPLCDAVAGCTGSRSLLERLEHANLFIIPLDQSCTWYRYHHLFSDLLRQRLKITETLSEKKLHLTASRWFATEGFAFEAIQHALAASAWEQAAELIGSNAVMMLRRGEVITLLGWLKPLPDEVVYARPLLCRDFGWALTLTGQMDAADAYLHRAEAANQGDEALGTVLVAQAYHLYAGEKYHQAIERAQRALNLLPQTDALSRSLVALTLGLAYWRFGNYLEAEQAFMEVDQAGQQSHNHYARMTGLAYLGIIQAVKGRLHRAAELCRQVILLAEQSHPAAPAHIELGTLLYEWNELESVAHHLQIGIEGGQRTGNLLFQSDGYRALALLHQALGEPDTALSVLQKDDQLVKSQHVAAHTKMRNAACHVQLALAQGDLATAQYWAEQVTEPADASPSFSRLGLTSARLLLAQGKKAEAAQELARLYDTVVQAGWGSAAVEVRALQALAAPTTAEALHYLEDALKLAQPEGFIRTFVDKGEPMKALLERLRAQGGQLKGYIQALLAAFGETGRAIRPQPLFEPLSERELVVLRLMAEGLSNQEIAGKLVITLGTAKSHVHHILEKVGGSNRAQAVAKARELGLL